jgi:hypothetical protein
MQCMRSWKDAEKNKATPFNYSDIQNLATITNNAVSRTSATTEQVNTRNETVAVDWAIVNKTAIPGEPNVFAVFQDVNVGIVHTVCTTSRGLAREALIHYIQQWEHRKRSTTTTRRNF